MKNNKISLYSPLVILVCMVLFMINSINIVLAAKNIEKKNFFNIHTKIMIDKKLVSTPQIITRENDKASIIVAKEGGSEALNMEVVAKSYPANTSKNAIQLNFDIRYKNGNENIHTKPKLILLSDQEGRVRVASDSGHIYEMYVLVERK